MPVKYNKETEKNGAAIGSVVSIVRPRSYPNSSFASNEPAEAQAWNIDSTYPGWLECDGRTLNVAEYRALYSVIGNTYGGTPNVNFKLPDYRSKKICGTGRLNGNSGSSLFLPFNSGPDGNPGGGGLDISGSTGGFYTINTLRQLPEGSEITPGSPSDPGVIGGNSVDTFSLGSYRSQGFESVVDIFDCELSGDITFGVGPISERTVAAIPPHFHFISGVAIGNTTAKAATGGAIPIGESPNALFRIFSETTGSIRNFNRRLRRWPLIGDATPVESGISIIESGPVFFGLSGGGSLPDGVAIGTFQSSPSGSFSGFGFPPSSEFTPTTQYVWFKDGSSNQLTRSVSRVIPDGSQIESVQIEFIAGNDQNGGERPNGAGSVFRFNGSGIALNSDGNPVNGLVPGTGSDSPDPLAPVPAEFYPGPIGTTITEQDESLFIRFSSIVGGVSVSSGNILLIPSFRNSSFAGDTKTDADGNTVTNFDRWDAEYANWFVQSIPVASNLRGSNFTIEVFAYAAAEVDRDDPDQNTSRPGSNSGQIIDTPQDTTTPTTIEFDGGGVGIWDNYGIGRVVVSGTGGSFSFGAGDEPAPLQKHSHMIFWDEPNIIGGVVETVPGNPTTFGTGGGVDLTFVDEGATQTPNGLYSGAAADVGPLPSWPENRSIGSQIEKTISVLNDIAITIRPAVVRLSDTSRLSFDSAISVRLQAAEEFNLLTDFFRTKYLIKAY
jgi:hypothetical protein